MEISQETRTKVEEYRNSTSSTQVEWLKKLQTDLTGYQFQGCFCKSSNREAFMRQFYDWYDKLNTNNQ